MQILIGFLLSHHLWATCADQVDHPSVDLPAALGMTTARLDHAREVPAAWALVNKLSRIFEALDEVRLTRLGQALTWGHIVRRTHPDQANLMTAAWVFGDALELGEIELAAELLPEIKKPIGPIMKIQKQRFELVLQRPNYRRTLLALLESGLPGELRLLRLQLFLNRTPKLWAPLSAPQVLTKVLNEVRGGQVSPRVFGTCIHILNELFHEIQLYSQRAHGIEVRFGSPIEVRSAIDRYFTEAVRVEAPLNLIEVIMGSFGGTLDPLPPLNLELRNYILDRANQRLLPFKIAAAGTPTQKVRAVAPLNYQVADQFKPAKSVARMRTTTPAVDTSRLVPPTLPVERDLRHFTLLSDRPRPLTELDAGVPYEFWFLRDEQFTRRRVIVFPAARAWLLAHEKSARQILTILNHGWAAGSEPGLRVARHLSAPQLPGRLITLTLGTYRPLLIKTKDTAPETWHLLAIATPDTERDVAEHLTP